MGTNKINVGNVVIIYDERKPRNIWKLGRMEWNEMEWN